MNQCFLSWGIKCKLNPGEFCIKFILRLSNSVKNSSSVKKLPFWPDRLNSSPFLFLFSKSLNSFFISSDFFNLGSTAGFLFLGGGKSSPNLILPNPLSAKFLFVNSSNSLARSILFLFFGFGFDYDSENINIRSFKGFRLVNQWTQSKFK